MGQGQGVKYHSFCKLCSQTTEGNSVVSLPYCQRCTNELTLLRHSMQGLGTAWLPATWFAYCRQLDEWRSHTAFEDDF